MKKKYTNEVAFLKALKILWIFQDVSTKKWKKLAILEIKI